MGFNSAFKGLREMIRITLPYICMLTYNCVLKLPYVMTLWRKRKKKVKVKVTLVQAVRPIGGVEV